MPLHNVRHRLENVEMKHVIHGNVDGDRKPSLFCSLPTFQNRRRLFPDILVKAMNLSRILQYADELPRREEAFFGMIPAHECLRAEQFSFRRNLRLQVDGELAFGQAFLETSQDFLFAQRALHQGIVIECHLVAILIVQEGKCKVRAVAHDGNGHLQLLDLIDAEMNVQLE